MPNITTVQILDDGRENCILKFFGEINTADLTSTVVVDPALLSDLGPFAGLKASKLRIKYMTWMVEDTLAMNLFWDASVPVLIGEYVGRGSDDYRRFGGFQNNAGAGITGKITATSQGWVASAILSFTMLLELGKQ